ncbi:MAG: LCP family protein [Actinobacteria bacterium]|jgi:LCP family protein required for cell wall assembly|nr:LCP family protein [Ilumatobacteraceae bacterium]MDA0299960.1 LCP family protein [Actinomycetota bacterium]MDA2995456.1 LCP family protein [Actinomycetota bacterium]
MTQSTSATRTWPQRLTIFAAALVSFICLLTAIGLIGGRLVLGQRQLVVIEPSENSSVSASAGPSTRSNEVNDEELSIEEVIEVTIGDIEPGARNFLLVGTDNNACIDPDSKYAPYLLGRADFGERADVIQMWRVNTDTGAIAALSFPRDLYVRLDGGRRGRINSAFDAEDPNRLISTIRSNFGIDTDHYVQIDFCAFKNLVDSVGGVGIPFSSPVRDRGTGLEIRTSGCSTLNGDDALAYVRSRKLEFERPSGSDNWVIDASSDWGRIARQQDFIKRTLATVVNSGLTSPSVAGALIETNADQVVTDSNLSVSTMLGFANILRSVDTSNARSYQIDAAGRIVGGQSVLIPTLQNSAMRSILDIFQGDSLIEGSPITLNDVTTSVDPEIEQDAPVGAAGESTPLIAGLQQQDTPDDNTLGWVPDSSVICD